MKRSYDLADHLLIEMRIRVIQFSKAYYKIHKKVAGKEDLRKIVFSAMDEVQNPYLRTVLRRGFRGVAVKRDLKGNFSVNFLFLDGTKKRLKKHLGAG